MLLTSWLRPRPSRTARAARSLRPAVERLEHRTLLTGAITGAVFVDSDGDGTRDPGEQGAAGVTIYADLDRDGSRDAGEAAATTDSQGVYTLSGLAPAEYVVRAVAPNGFAVSTPGASAFYYALDGTADRLLRIDAASGAVTPVGPLGTPMHGLVRTNDGRLFGITDDPDPDRFWSVDPATGAATLIGPANAELGRGLTYDAATDTIYGVGDVGNSGFYRLGTFDRATGAFEAIAGAAPVSRDTLTGTPGLAFDPVKRRIVAYEFDGSVWEFTTAGAARVISWIDAGLGRSLTHDGRRFVMKADDAPYLLEIDPDAGTWRTTTAVSSSGFITESLEYVASPGNGAHVVTVREGQTSSGFDFGLTSTAGRVTGSVYKDADGDGERDAGERGLSNVTVYLDLDRDGSLDAEEPTAVSAADGSYVFDDVAPGRYFVRQLVPAGLRQTSVGSGNGFYYATDVTNRRLMRIDEATGAVTPVALQPPAGWSTPALHGLALTNDGSLYALEANLSTDVLWKIDPATGVLTRIGSTGHNHAWGMTYDPAADAIYGVAYIGGRVRLGTIDRSTGAFTAVPTGFGPPSNSDTGAGALTGTGGLAFDTDRRRIIAYDFHDGEIYAFALDGTAAKISQTTANLSGSLAYDGERFVMERRAGGGLISLDPDAGTWTSIVGVSTDFFEEALEHVPGRDPWHVVTVHDRETVSGRDFGDAQIAPVAPTASPDDVAVGEDAAVTGNVLLNDSDPDGDPLTVSAVNGVAANVGATVTLTSGARLTVNADGTLAYDPNGRFESLKVGETATETFTYSVADGQGGTSTATVTVTITGANDGPTAGSDSATVPERGTAVGNVLANDADPDGDPLAVTAVNGGAAVGATVTLASGANLRVNADGTFAYDPNGKFARLRRGETATDTFTYTVSDGHSGTATATATVAVVGAALEADLIGYHAGTWQVAASTGSAFDSRVWSTWQNLPWDALVQGDFDGDGRTDVLGLLDGLWQVGLARGAGVSATFATTLWGRWENLDWRDVTVGDLNGDGRDDIVARFGGQWHAALSGGTAFGGRNLWAAWHDAPWKAVALADLNGDGKDDLLANSAGQWHAALSTGSKFGGRAVWSAWSDLAWEKLGTFDADGDGRTDVVGFYRGTWQVGRSTGTGFATSLLSRWAVLPWKDPVTGDFDGDGKADVAARAGGLWQVTLATGATSVWEAWPDEDWKDVRAGDFDGDGRDDLVARRPGGNLRVAISTGSAFVSAGWGRWADVPWRAVAAADAGPAAVAVPAGSASASPRVASSPAAAAPAARAAADEDEALKQFWAASDEDEKFAAGLVFTVR